MNSPKYVKVYLPMLVELDIRSTAANLLLIIDLLTRKEGYCYASKTYLAKALNVTEPTIYNALNKLEERDLIIREHGSQYKTSRIYVSEKWKTYIEEVRWGNLKNL
jgi:DNA-binding PadR family transcriptional regulator